MMMKKILFTLVLVLFSASAYAATSVPFTIAISEAVNVTGSPRIAVDVGGVTRYATYASGTGTSSLTFTYDMVAGDVDLDGVTLSSPIDLNGGTITDLNGNPETDLTFTVPNTSGIKIDYPSLSMDFIADADGRYTLNGTAYNDLPSFLTATGGTFSRNSIATYYDASGIMQTASANQPRFDHDPVTGERKGILIEESRTNLLTRSSEFDNAIWVKTNASIVANNATSPDGTTTADKLVPNTSAASGTSYPMQMANVSAGVKYTRSQYLKAGEFTQVVFGIGNGFGDTNMRVNLNNGTVITPPSGTTDYGVVNVGNGWYRAWFSKTSAATSVGGCYIIPEGATGDGISGLYIWGAQLETGAFPTSYIPTTGAAVTRAPDDLTIPVSSWINQNKGALFTQSLITSLGGTAYPGSASLDDGTVNNAIQLIVTDAGSDAKASEIFQGGISQFTAFQTPYVAGQILKSAIGYDVNNVIFSYDGLLTPVDGTAIIPTTTQLRLGRNRSDKYLNGQVQKLKYYPVRVSDTQLQLMTQ